MTTGGSISKSIVEGHLFSNMVKHIYASFLRDTTEYALSERHWNELWHGVEPHGRMVYGWQSPWFQPLPPALGEGNPIFSAVSQELRRGIRIIQHEPTGPVLEIQVWTDYFGGRYCDPDSIEEIVISCALSDSASRVALSLMEPWIRGEAISFVGRERGYLKPDDTPHEQRSQFTPPLRAA